MTVAQFIEITGIPTTPDTDIQNANSAHYPYLEVVGKPV